VKQQHTSTATSILTIKSTYSSLSAQRLTERTVYTVQEASFYLTFQTLQRSVPPIKIALSDRMRTTAGSSDVRFNFLTVLLKIIRFPGICSCVHLYTRTDVSADVVSPKRRLRLTIRKSVTSQKITFFGGGVLFIQNLSKPSSWTKVLDSLHNINMRFWAYVDSNSVAFAGTKYVWTKVVMHVECILL
jgi:hypothetical protein